jgi:hypothetical protein
VLQVFQQDCYYNLTFRVHVRMERGGTTHDVNRVFENVPTNISPVSNGSHPVHLRPKNLQCANNKTAKYGLKIAIVARLCIILTYLLHGAESFLRS